MAEKVPRTYLDRMAITGSRLEASTAGIIPESSPITTDTLKPSSYQYWFIMFWAVTIVNSPQEMQNVRLAVGSNSASMWWLNGKEVVDLFGDRRMVMDDCVSKRLTLAKGPNVIRGAVINGPGMSDFCVRFINDIGEPITDLTLSIDNTGDK